MSWTEYDDACTGCRPVLIDPFAKPLPDDHPAMVAVLAVWDATDLPTRQAWHAVTCTNSRTPEHMALVRPLLANMQRALG